MWNLTITNKIEITDPQWCQLCIKVTNTAYEYFELKSFVHVLKQIISKEQYSYLLSLTDKEFNSFDTCQFIKDCENNNNIALSILNNPMCWRSMVIDANNYDENEQIDILSAYYTKNESIEMKNKYIETYYQLICEAVFEDNL